MKIRLIAPKWLKKRRAEREDKLLDVLDETYYGSNKPFIEKIEDWYDVGNINLANIIGGFVVLLVGFSLIEPMSDAISEAGDNITISWNDSNETTGEPSPIIFDLFGSKFFLFLMLVVLMLVVGPFLMWRAMGFTRNAEIY